MHLQSVPGYVKGKTLNCEQITSEEVSGLLLQLWPLTDYASSQEPCLNCTENVFQQSVRR